jgi:hypothetical protein
MSPESGSSNFEDKDGEAKIILMMILKDPRDDGKEMRMN